ncbi:MAG: DUF1549 domain-containing protein [Acidobacteria bacterium]|nr:DUF1549 domain-containing protein [Acidobacteriota bacterium]
MKTFARFFKIGLLLCLAGIVTALFFPIPVTRAQSASRVDFNREIRPILSDKCFACHGPDATAKRIKLRLDSEEGMKADLGGGRRAVVAGQPESSELIKRITHRDADLRMPPASTGRTLTPQEIALLTEWIKQGANWQSHWSFIKPIRPQLPAIKNKNWVRNEIDYFVAARLEQLGLQPSPEADRATLLRRLSFDLTGLPPTLKELDDFLNDKSPTAYEKVVDRLLASPRYGERMAFKWLDAARYADTNGYQIDGERSMWRWRDWVIDAFNRNQPFDQFTIEQLAGDLLPNATFEQKIATAFNRNHRTNSEDGIVPEEYAVEYIVDRVDTTSTVFLGLTMGCARCHNHKFDPFTQKEYYQLFSYFNSIPEDGRANNYGNSAPWISAPTPHQKQQLQELESRIAASDEKLTTLLKQHSAARQKWEQSLDRTRTTQWFPDDNLVLQHTLDANSDVKLSDAVVKIDMSKPDEETIVRKGDKPEERGFRSGSPNYLAGPIGQAIAFDGNLFFDAGKVADFNFRDRLKDYKDQFSISAWFYPEVEQRGAIVTHMGDGPNEKDNNLPKGRGYGLFFANGKIHFNLVGVWADDSFRVETADPVSLKQWHHVVATFDATEPYDKVQLFLDGKKQQLKINNPRLFRSFGDANANLRIGGGGGPEFRFKGMIDEVRIYKSLPDPDDVAVLSCADSIEKIAAIPSHLRTTGQQVKITKAWLALSAPASVRDAWQRLRDLKKQKPTLEAEFPTLMVMQELPQPRQAFLLRRGAYDLPTEKVFRAVPATLHPAGMPQPTNRLEFARWLVHQDNPLMARVTVNRFWQMIFGTGLVKTVEDFGAQGELPSHPELLDWLAVELRNGTGSGSDLASGANPLATARGTVPTVWDIKALLKTIVMSATYRQSAKVTPQLLQRDPDNRLLARASRFRLSAEMIRDQALLTSGLLVEKRGGPSVKPYQPTGLWKDMTFSNMTNYPQDKGEGLWRRSLYTFWKRTILNPSMNVFDATAREFCSVRETRTNSPLQALNLMNDVTYIEAARMLAQRVMLEAGTSADERLAFAFRALTSRWPDQLERQTLLGNFNAQQAYFRANPAEAEKLLLIGEKRNDAKLNPVELAAYATTVSLILNLDEVITRQ